MTYTKIIAELKADIHSFEHPVGTILEKHGYLQRIWEERRWHFNGIAAEISCEPDVSEG